MNRFMNTLENENNMTYTENGARTYKSTLDGLMDMFAMGAAYRTRSDSDCIFLFKKAYDEDPIYALRCLFYIRDILEGQGERRFFRVVMKWFAQNYTNTARTLIRFVPKFGRWDDLYTFVGTPLERDMFTFMHEQFVEDIHSITPSLLAKWLKSENTSSQESRKLAIKTRMAFHLTPREYRKHLSMLRARIKVVERLMSANKWDEIEFDKIPSKAGMIYRNAFARHDVERMRSKKNVQSYEDFAKDKNTKVNAKALYPYEVLGKALNLGWAGLREVENTERLMINKYWENLTDYFKGCTFNGICVADTSGSMYGTPIQVALSIAMYCAEHNRGVFANHFFTFSSKPTFVKIDGIDFVDKARRMVRDDWGGSTNIESVFNMMLQTAQKSHCSQSEIPANVIIISDMEFDSCVCGNSYHDNRYNYRYAHADRADETLFETIERRWRQAGYQMPKIVFWNVQARQDNIPMRTSGHVTYVSGFSPVLFEQILKGKTSYDLMMDKLNSKRYSCIR